MGYSDYSNKEVKKEKTGIIFWNVDTQKDFMLPSGKLYIKDAETILPNLSLITSLAIKNNILVISTGDYHSKEDPEIFKTPDFVNTFPEHCIFSEEGAEFVDQTYPKLISRSYYLITPNTTGLLSLENLKRARDIILYKNVFNIFKGNEYVEAVLEIVQPKTIVVYGVSTDYCVRYAVEGLLERKYDVILVTDAIKGINEINSKKLIDKWSYEDGVRLYNTSELEKLINGNT